MTRFLAACVILLISAFPALHAQKQPLSVKVLELVNEARTRPLDFLKAHKAELASAPKDFVAQLQRNEKLPEAIWDTGLEAVCREKVEKGTLNPDYKGNIAHCGTAEGMRMSSSGHTPMEIIIEFSANLFDPNCVYYGMAFDDSEETYWYSWGYRCDRIKEQFVWTGKVDSSKVDFAKLNTAKDAKYLTPNEKRMILELNFVRAYPKVYADIVRYELALEAENQGGLSHDDFVAAKELLSELATMEPMQILKPMECVYAAAKKHGLDCKKRGFMDHKGSDGSMPWNRILERCPSLSYGNENLVGGHDTPRRSLIALLVDGGISGRGHRHNALNRDWKYVGCYFYSMGIEGFPGYGNWVQNFAK